MLTGVCACAGMDRSAADDHAKEAGRGRERISWSAWKGSQAMTRAGSDDGELPQPDTGDDQPDFKASPVRKPSRPRSGSRGRQEVPHRRPTDQPSGWDARGRSPGAGRSRAPPAGRRPSARPFRDPLPYDARRLPPPFVEEELRRGSLDFYDRPDAYPGMMLSNGYPPHLRAIPGDVRGRSVQYLAPSLPPHADPYHPGPGPLHDRGPPPGGYDHRRYRSVSPQAHLRGMPAWASPPDRDALPPARVVRHHDGSAWPSRPPSPGPLPRGFDPGRRPSDSLDHSLPPHYCQDPSRGYPRRYLSPPREYAARPPSGQDPRPDLMARGRRPLSPSPPRRPQHPLHAPLGRYPAADGYGRGEWEPPRQGGPGLAPLRHSSGSLPHRLQQSPPPPMRMPPAQDRLERRGPRPLPFGGHPRDISPPRDAAYRDALAGPSGRGYGEAGLAPLRHIERWDAAPSRPGFQESSRLPPHMLDRFDGPRLVTARDPMDVDGHHRHTTANGRLPPQQSARSRPQQPLPGQTSLPLPPAVRAREGRPSKQTGWDMQPSPEPGQVLRSSHPAHEAAETQPDQPRQPRPEGQDRSRQQQSPAPAERPRSGRAQSPKREAMPPSSRHGSKPVADGGAASARPLSQPDAGGSKHKAQAEGADRRPAHADRKPPARSGEKAGEGQHSPARKRERSPVRDPRRHDGGPSQDAKRSRTEPEKPSRGDAKPAARQPQGRREEHGEPSRHHHTESRTVPKPASTRADERAGDGRKGQGQAADTSKQSSRRVGENRKGDGQAAGTSKRTPTEPAAGSSEKQPSRAHGASDPKQSDPKQDGRARPVPNGIASHRTSSPVRRETSRAAGDKARPTDRSSKPADGRGRSDGRETSRPTGPGSGPRRNDDRNGKRSHSPVRGTATGRPGREDSKRPRTGASGQAADDSKGKEPASKGKEARQRASEASGQRDSGSKHATEKVSRPSNGALAAPADTTSPVGGPHANSLQHANGSAPSGTASPAHAAAASTSTRSPFDAHAASPQMDAAPEQMLQDLPHVMEVQGNPSAMPAHAAISEADRDLMPTAILEPDLSPTYEQLEASLERSQAQAAAHEHLSSRDAAAADAGAIGSSQPVQPDMYAAGVSEANGWPAEQDLQGTLDEPQPGGGNVAASLVPLLVDPSPGWDQRQEWSYMDPDGDSHGLFTIKQIRQWLSSMARKPDLRQQFEDFKVASVWRVNRADQRMPLYQVVSADGWTMSV